MLCCIYSLFYEITVPVNVFVFVVHTGFVEVCMMHPLDLIKTRFQIQRGADDPTRYSSMLDCVRKMYRTEG